MHRFVVLGLLVASTGLRAADPPQVTIQAQMNPPDFVHVGLSWEPVPEACKYFVYLRSLDGGPDSLILRTADTQIDFTLPTGWSYYETPDLVRTLFVTAEDECVPPQEGLVAWYVFNGDADNQVTDAHDGTVLGAQFCPDRFEQEQSALHFDGVNDYVWIADPIHPAAASVGTWFRTTGGSTMSFVRERNYGYHLAVLHDGSGDHLFVDCYVGDGSLRYTWIGPAGEAIDGEWHHLVWTYSGDRFRVYLDGGPLFEDGSHGAGLPLHYRTLALALGRQADYPGDYYNGDLDEVFFYDRALTADEVEDIYLLP